jgi:hypothetical protein
MGIGYKYWFHFRKIKFFFANFNVLKTWLEQKKNPSVTCHRRRRTQKFVPHLQPPPLELESWNFGCNCGLGQLDACHFWNFEFSKFLESNLKIWNLKNTDLTKIIRKLGFRVLMCSNKRCILVIVKKLHTQNFEIWKKFEQKFCKTHILNLGMTITLANWKLRSNTWCRFVRIGVFHMT